MSTYHHTALCIDHETKVEARGQGSGDNRILVFELGEWAVTVQGSPADMLALVDRIRDAVVATAEAKWPGVTTPELEAVAS